MEAKEDSEETVLKSDQEEKVVSDPLERIGTYFRIALLVGTILAAGGTWVSTTYHNQRVAEVDTIGTRALLCAEAGRLGEALNLLEERYNKSIRYFGEHDASTDIARNDYHKLKKEIAAAKQKKESSSTWW